MLNNKLFVFLLLVLGCFILQYRVVDCSLNNDSSSTLQEIRRTDSNSIQSYLTFEYILNFETYGADKLANHLQMLMPGYYAIAKVVEGSFDPELQEVALRTMSIIFIALACGFLFLTAGLLMNKSDSIFAALFIFSAPFIHYHGLNIRFYALQIFLSVFLLYLTILLAKKVTTARLFAFSFFLFIPLLIHISSLLTVFLCFAYFVFNVWNKLNAKLKVSFIATAGIVGLFILPNTAAFLYSRFIYDGSSNVMSASFLSFLTSLIFNFGIGFCFLVVFGLLNLFKNKEFRLLTILTLVCFAGVVAAAFLRHDLFRPDYLLPLFPVVILLAAGSLAISFESLSRRIVIAVLAILIVLPSTFSNLFIDQDRFNYKLAYQDIIKEFPEGSLLIYSLGQTNFPQNVDSRVTYVNLGKFPLAEEANFSHVVYAIPWKRQGFSKDFVVFHDLRKRYKEIFESSSFLKVSGKNRLDMKDYLFFLYAK